MTQHKIVKIPDWVTPESETFLNEVGLQGWELVHLYNQHAYMKASTAGTLASGSTNSNSGYTMRPFIRNQNWGGTNQSACNAPTQTITI